MARVILVGYGQMLYSLIKGIKNSHHEIVGVLRVDRLKYNKIKLFLKDVFNPSQDYTVIKAEGLWDIKANSVNSEEFLKEIDYSKPDLILVASWGEKFKNQVLEKVPVLNFHPSLLPKNRGANPYFWTIYNNQKTTGLTVHFMDEKFDTGDIVAQYEIEIAPDETGYSLKNKTTMIAADVVKDILNLFEKKQLQPIKQNEMFATYEHQITSKETLIDLRKPKIDIERHFRALYPWANPTLQLGRRVLEFNSWEFLENLKNLRPYKVVKTSNNYIVVAGYDYLLKIYL
ncbi:methionyl-tRNA formyltransferase [bacterium]|nr:methionyl-tRNA formyltransferase [bacterium]